MKKLQVFLIYLIDLISLIIGGHFRHLQIHPSPEEIQAHAVAWSGANIYKLFYKKLNFFEAEYVCKQESMLLASIADSDVNRLIKEKVFHYSSFLNKVYQIEFTDYWIGYKNLILTNEFSWTDNNVSSFTNWQDGKPNNESLERCVLVAKDNGEWYDFGCYQKRSFVCKLTNREINDLYRSNAKLTYYEAERQCLTEGGIIPDVSDKYTLQDVIYNTKPRGDKVWVRNSELASCFLVDMDSESSMIADCNKKHFSACKFIKVLLLKSLVVTKSSGQYRPVFARCDVISTNQDARFLKYCPRLAETGNEKPFNYEVRHDLKNFEEAQKDCQLAVVESFETMAYIYGVMSHALSREPFYIAQNSSFNFDRTIKHKEFWDNCFVLRETTFQVVDCRKSLRRICQTPSQTYSIQTMCNMINSHEIPLHRLSIEDECKKMRCPNNKCIYKNEKMYCKCGKDEYYDKNEQLCKQNYCKVTQCDNQCIDGKCSCKPGFQLDGKNRCNSRTCLANQCEVKCSIDGCGCNEGQILNVDGKTCSKYFDLNSIVTFKQWIIVNVQDKQMSKHDNEFMTSICNKLGAHMEDINVFHENSEDITTLKNYLKMNDYVFSSSASHGYILYQNGHEAFINAFDIDFEYTVCRKKMYKETLKRGFNFQLQKATYQNARIYCGKHGAILINIDETKDVNNLLKTYPAIVFFAVKNNACVKVQYNKNSLPCSEEEQHHFICHMFDEADYPFIYKVVLDRSALKSDHENKCDLADVSTDKAIAMVQRKNPFIGQEFYVNSAPCTFFRDGRILKDLICSFHISSRGRICQFLNTALQEECERNCPTKNCSFANDKLMCHCPEHLIYDESSNQCKVVEKCNEAPENPGCSHNCTLVSGVPQCFCPVGWYLDKDKKTCKDLFDVCDNSLCKQECKVNITDAKKYSCSCNLGYTTQDDGKTCLDTFDERQYIYSYDYHFWGITHLEAEALSVKKGVKLHSIANKKELNQTKKIFPKFHQGYNFWIGLKFDPDEQNYIWSDGTTTASITDVLDEEKPDGLRCYAYNSNTQKLSSHKCSDTLDGGIFKSKAFSNCKQCSQFCKRTENGFFTCTCHPGYSLNNDYSTCKELFDVEKYRYIYLDGEMTFHEAIQRCLDIGSFPTSISSIHEQFHILQIGRQSFSRHLDKKFFIGLESKVIGNFFHQRRFNQWLDRSVYNYDNFQNPGLSPSELHKTCAVLNVKDGLWKYVYCHELFDGVICKRLRLCHKDICKNGGSCIENNDTTSCLCRKGFQGLHCEEAIDTCKLNAFMCNQSCVNNVGGHTCTCREGFKLGFDGKSCFDENLVCPFHGRDCEQKCVEPSGKGKSYTCECWEGYKMIDGHCQDIDECEDHEKGTCINTIGSYSLQCKDNEEWDEKSHKCISYNFTTARYFVSSEALSFSDGEKQCAAMGGRLASISGPKERDYLERRIENNTFRIVQNSLSKYPCQRKNNCYLIDCPVSVKNDINGNLQCSSDDASAKQKFICRMPDIFQPVPQHFNYFISDYKTTWEKALDRCFREDAELLYITTEKEQMYVENGYTDRIWIGVKKNSGNVSWFNGLPVTGGYSNLDEQRSSFESGYGFMEKKSDFRWSFTDGSEQNRFVCKKLYFKHGPYKFYISHQKFQFASAKEFCYSLEGQLVTYLDESEDTFLDSVLLKNEPYWIGLVKNNADYKWLDGSKFRYENIGNYYRNGDCTIKEFYENRFQWFPSSCDKYAYAICKVDFIRLGVFNYKFNDEVRSWKDAEKHCERFNGNLASIQDKQVEEKIKSQILTSETYWIGFSETNSVTKWSDQSFLKYDNFESKNDCGLINKAMEKLQSLDCKQKRSSVCKIREFPFDNFQYNTSETTKTWDEAHASCNAIDGELLSIANNEELILREFITAGVEYWIGMISYENNPVWIDGSPLIHSRMSGFSQLNDECVYMIMDDKNNFKWKTANCNKKKKYLCKTPKYYSKDYFYYLSTLRVDSNEAHHICEGENAEFLAMRFNSDAKGICLNFDRASEHNGAWLKKACQSAMTFACKKPRFTPYIHMYDVRINKVDWSKAEDYCVKNGGNLLAISSKFEEEYLADRMVNNVEYWTGGKGRHDDFRWSNEEAVVVYKQYIFGDDNCLSIYKNNDEIYWQYRSCNHKAAFICEKPTLFNESRYEYKIINEQTNQLDGRLKCLTEGYEIATITHSKENVALKSLLKASNVEKCWIGYYYFPTSSSFKWFSGEFSNFNKLAISSLDQKKSYGTTLSSNGEWKAARMEELFCTLCRKRRSGIKELYGDKNPAPSARKPCRNLGTFDTASNTCKCKDGFNGTFCQDGEKSVSDLKKMLQDIFDDVVMDNFDSAISAINKGLDNDFNIRCMDMQVETFCKIQSHKHKLYDSLIKYNTHNQKEVKAALISWLLVHDIKVEDTSVLSNVLKAVLGLIYKYLTTFNENGLHQISLLQPNEYINELMPSRVMHLPSMKTKEVRSIVRDTLESVSSFLASIQKFNSKTKVVITRYDLKEKLKQLKFSALSNRVELESLRLEKELTDFSKTLKKFISDTYSSRFAALGNYLNEVAIFDKEKDLKDLQFFEGRLNDFNVKLKKSTATLSADLKKTIVLALSATALDLAEAIAEAIADFFSGGGLFSVFNNLGGIINKMARVSRAAKLLYSLEDIAELCKKLSSGFKLNRHSINKMLEVIKNMSSTSSAEKIQNLSNNFLKKYKEYGPKVRKQDLSKLGIKFETFYREACNLISETTGIAAASVEVKLISKGYCFQKKENIAYVIALQEELHDYQNELTASIARVARSFLAAQYSSELKSSLPNHAELAKNYSLEMMYYEQQALHLVMASRLDYLKNIYLFCDYREYIDGGVQPRECKLALNRLTDNSINNLISLRNQHCDRVRTAVALIPTQVNSKIALPLQKLYSGEEIEFQLDSIEWLVRHNWISPFGAYRKAYYLREFNLILPYMQPSYESIVVKLSWSNESRLFPSHFGKYYVLDSGSYVFEYKQRLTCFQNNIIVNPYDTCKTSKPLCRISLPQDLHIYPSLFSKFKIKVRMPKGAVTVPQFTTDFYLKAIVKICEVDYVSGNKVNIIHPRIYHAMPQCCVRDACNGTRYNEYWHLDSFNARCDACPHNSKVHESGYFCIKN